MQAIDLFAGFEGFSTGAKLAGNAVPPEAARQIITALKKAC